MSLRVGLLGLGTVGGGTVEVLRENAAEIERRAGRAIQVVRAAVRDLERPRSCSVEGIELTEDPFAVVNAPDVDVVVELIGGTALAGDLVKAALKAGKPVVTANKALIAEHGEELFALSRETGCDIAFDAAVAGGIPVIKALREGLSANRIESLVGIINGTTNFILTQMEAQGAEFADALAEAQAKGYAEADPTFDIEGIDAAHKLAILAALGLEMPLAFERVSTVGIGEVSAADIRYARELGYRIKHLAIARRSDRGVELRVEPTLVPVASFVAKIDGVLNGVLIQGNAVGPTGYYGAGAGAMATASSVVADLIDVARGRVLPPPISAGPATFADEAQINSSFYLRMQAADQPGVIREISTVLANLDISIEAIVQREQELRDGHATVVLVTHEVPRGTILRAMDALSALPVIHGPIVSLRLEHLN